VWDVGYGHQHLTLDWVFIPSRSTENGIVIIIHNIVLGICVVFFLSENSGMGTSLRPLKRSHVLVVPLECITRRLISTKHTTRSRKKSTAKSTRTTPEGDLTRQGRGP
jgi:hypothetical protein